MQKYKKISRHMKVQEEKEKNRDTWRSQGIEKVMCTWRLIKKWNDSHVSKKTRERSLIQKEYIIDLEMFYPHTCTSWSKGMSSFSLDLSFDSTKYAE